MTDIRIPYGWCLLACMLFVLLAGWMAQLGAMYFALAFATVAALCVMASLLGYLNAAAKFQDVDRGYK